MNRYEEVRQAIHEKWLMQSRQDGRDRHEEGLRYQLGGITEEVLQETSVVLTERERRTLIQEVSHEVQGLGPLEPLMRDPDVTDILVNGPHQVFIEKGGRLREAGVRFTSPEHLRTTLDRMLLSSGRRIDESSPMVDARLPSGARLHALLPPVAIDGITLSIRKFRPERLSLHDLVSLGTLSEPLATDLEALVCLDANILIAGGTGSGKTTLLNAMAGAIPRSQRVVTLEEAAELSLDLPHVVRLEGRPPNIEGQGEITLKDLLRNALRMRPDRIIVGEVRGREAFEMLQAMNSGHCGSMATLHANSPRDALIRLENLMVEAGVVLNLESLRRQMLNSIQVILQMKRFSDGVRRITSLGALSGLESGTFLLEEWGGYRLDQGFFRVGNPQAMTKLMDALC